MQQAHLAKRKTHMNSIRKYKKAEVNAKLMSDAKKNQSGHVLTVGVN